MDSPSQLSSLPVEGDNTDTVAARVPEQARNPPSIGVLADYDEIP